MPMSREEFEQKYPFEATEEAASNEPVVISRKQEDYDPSVNTGDYLVNSAKRGLAAVVGFPNDLLSLLTMGASEKMFANSAKMAEMYLGYNPYLKAPSKGARAAGVLAENISAAVPWGAARAGLTIAQGGGRALAATKLGMDVAAGVGAGAGQLMAENIAPDSPMASVAGQVLGSLGPVSLGAKLERGVAAARELNIDKQSLIKAKGRLDSLAAKSVDRMVLNAVQGEDKAVIASRIEEAQALQQRFPDIKLDLEQVVGTPGLRSLAMASAQESSRNLNLKINRDMAARKELLSGLEDMLPSSNKTLDDALSGAFVGMRGTIEGLNKQLTKLDDGMVQLVNEFPRMGKEAAGKQLRTIAMKEQELAKKAIDLVFAEPAKMARKFHVKYDMENIVNLYKQMARDPAFKADPRSMPYIAGLLDKHVKPFEAATKVESVAPSKAVDYLNPGKASPKAKTPGIYTQDFDYLKSLRTAAGRDWKLEKSNGPFANQDRLRMLAGMLHSIDETMAHGIGKRADDVNGAYRAARQIYNEDYAPRFREGLNFQMMTAKAWGDPRVPDSRVVDAYASNAQNARAFKALFQGSAEAMQMFENGFMDVFYNKVVKGGHFDTNAYNAFMRKHGEVLEEFPSLKFKLSTVEGAQATVSQRKAFLHEEAKAIAESNLYRKLKADNVDSVVKKALANPKEMAKLVELPNFGKDGAQSLISYVMRDAHKRYRVQFPDDNKVLSTIAFKNFMEKNQDSLLIASKKAFGDKQGQEFVAGLNDIARMSEVIDRSPVSPGTLQQVETETDLLRQATGQGASEVATTLRQIGGRHGSPSYFVTSHLLRYWQFLTGKQMDSVLARAMEDPETQKKFLQLAKAPEWGKDEMAAARDMLGKVGYIMWGDKGGTTMRLLRRSPVYGADVRVPGANDSPGDGIMIEDFDFPESAEE